MYPKDCGDNVLAPGWECVAAPPGRLVILIAGVFLSLALGCDAQSSRPVPHGTSAGPGAGPQVLFDPSTPLGKGQEVHLIGRIEFHDPDEDLDADTAYARLNLTNGNCDILLDARGQEMVKMMDGRLVDLRAILTGEFSSDVSMSVTNGLNGRISKATRVPEIRVTDFKYVGPPKVSRIVDNGDGTALDKLVGLQWQKADDGNKRNWNEAVEYCKSLALVGHTDWHLPSGKELNALWDNAGRKKTLRTTIFVGLKADTYWSSSVQEDPDWVDAVSFNPKEHVGGEWKKGSNYVLCVRRVK